MAGVLVGHYATFFSADSGVKYLASKSLLHHWTNASIPYPFATYDPHGRYVLPLTAWINGHDFAGYSLPFEYLTALCMFLFGAAGTVVPSVVGTVCILLAQIKLAEALGLIRGRAQLLLLTVAATPVVFYSLTLWEHTLGVGLFCLGLVMLLRVHHSPKWLLPLAVAGGGLLCLSVLMRREMVIPSLILLAAMPLVLPKKDALLAGGIAFATLLLPLLAILAVNPQPLALGLTHASPGRAGILTGGSGAAPPSHWLRLEWLTSGGWATGLFLAASVILIALRLWKPRLVPGGMAVASAVTGGAFVVQLLSHYTWTNDNPLAFSPLLVLGVWLPLLFDWRDESTKTYFLVWALAFAGAFAIVWMAADYGGGQWGPRYLLFVFPLCLLLSLKARDIMAAIASDGLSKRLVAYSFVLLAAASVVLQAIGVQAVVSGNQQWASSANVIAAQPGKIVVSTGDPSVDSIPSVYGRKTVLWAATRHDTLRLMSSLRQQKLGPVTYLCGPRVACHWNGFEGWRHGRARRSTFVRYATYRLAGS